MLNISNKWKGNEIIHRIKVTMVKERINGMQRQ